MVDETQDAKVDGDAENETEGLNHDYYDEVEEGAHERSAQNVSLPPRHDRDLWQSTNIITHGTGPQVQDVAPVFEQARADALANPVTADADDEALKSDQAAAADEAQEKADAIRESDGYVAPTGAEAGQYDDSALEDQVPAENFSPAPETGDDQREVEDDTYAPGEVDTTENDQRVPENTEAVAADSATETTTPAE